MPRARITALVCILGVTLASCAAPINLAADVAAPSSTTTTTTVPPGSVPPPTTGVSTACRMTPPLPPETPPAPTDTGGAQPSSAELAQIQRIQSQTQQLRELPQASAPVQFIDTDQVNSTLDRYRTQRDRDNSQRIDPLAKQIGWVDEASTTEAEMQKLQQGLVLGFYIPSAQTLWVVQKDSTDLSPLQQATLSHEWVHALQDAAYDLRKRDDNVPQFDMDQSSAGSALAEGDATTFEDKWMQTYLTADQRREKTREELSIGTPGGAELGPLVGDLMMPYIQGPKFIKAVLSSSGSPPLSSVYDRPPKTTTEILHPDLYLAGFAAKDVALPDIGTAIGPGWTQTMGGTWGEYSSAMLVAGINGEPMPDPYLKQVSGWQGDCLGFWQNGDGRYGVVGTQWDDPASASAFADAVQRALTRAGATEGPGGFSVVDEDHLWKVTVDGSSTLVVFTNDEAAAAASSGLGRSTSAPGRIVV